MKKNKYYATFYKPKTYDKGVEQIANLEDFINDGSGLTDTFLYEKLEIVTKLFEGDHYENYTNFYKRTLNVAEGPMLMAIKIWEDFKDSHINFNKEDFYERFYIPKRSGGQREIIAPKEELKSIQNYFKHILENVLRVLPSNLAHAYVKNRSIRTNATYHSRSNHFIKIDFDNFFPSITTECLEQVLPQIGIFHHKDTEKWVWGNSYRERNKEIKYPVLQKFITNLIEISTLDDKLPQGTPLSPILSNLIMIPFDYHLNEALKAQSKPMIATRYADDVTISSFYAFADRKEDAKERMEGFVNIALINSELDKWLKIKPSKTTVSTKYGKNRITGIKVNAENKVTIGYKEKRKLKRDLARLIIQKLKGETLGPVNQVIGYLSFLHGIEPGYAKYLEETMMNKFNITGHGTINKFLNS